MMGREAGERGGRRREGELRIQKGAERFLRVNGDERDADGGIRVFVRKFVVSGRDVSIKFLQDKVSM